MTMATKTTFADPAKRRPGLLLSAEEKQKQIEAWLDEDFEKLILLCQERGIRTGPTMFINLALELARELYPEPRKRGAKSKWSDLTKGCLVVEIERLVREDSLHGIEWACTQLAKRDPWRSFLANGENIAESLRAKYYEFQQNKWAKTFRDAFKYYESQGTIEQWNELVLDAVKKSPEN